MDKITRQNTAIVTIDGPGGVGKGTVSLRLAKRLALALSVWWFTLSNDCLG